MSGNDPADQKEWVDTILGPKIDEEPVDAEVVDQVATLPALSPYMPEGGWHPDDFPSVSVALIPYTSNAMVRADPVFRILQDGWMYIETANVRVAIPDREEWAKFVNMGERLWNTHQRELANEKIPVPGEDIDIPEEPDGLGHRSETV